MYFIVSDYWTRKKTQRIRQSTVTETLTCSLSISLSVAASRLIYMPFGKVPEPKQINYTGLVQISPPFHSSFRFCLSLLGEEVHVLGAAGGTLTSREENCRLCVAE